MILAIDRKTMNSNYIFPDGEDNCSCTSCDRFTGYFKELSKGRIFYSMSSRIFILQGDSFEVLQKIEFGPFYSFNYIDSYYEEKTQ